MNFRSVCYISRNESFIDEKLEEKCAKENISVEKVIYFWSFCLYIGNENLSLTLKIEIFSFILIYGSYAIKRAVKPQA